MTEGKFVTDFYYQIKARGSEVWGGWSWPPIFSGKVSADNKRKAKQLIEDEYGRKFPLRVLKKDLENEYFLLRIIEIDKEDDRTQELFVLKSCQECDKKFRVIDKYNDEHEAYKGKEFCGYKCKKANHEKNRAPKPSDLLSQNGGAAFIYRIRNKKDDRSYIGKTQQVFTLRWYQHFYQSGSCKFHDAIRSSSLTDWEFSLIELVNVQDGVKVSDAVQEREAYWINYFNAVENGYNTVAVNSPTT